MIEPKRLSNTAFGFQKVFTELDYLAGGILSIPKGAQKPLKPAKDNSYVRPFVCFFFQERELTDAVLLG